MGMYRSGVVWFAHSRCFRREPAPVTCWLCVGLYIALGMVGVGFFYRWVFSH